MGIKVSKKGGTTLEKKGGTDPCPPPLNPPLFVVLEQIFS